MSEEGGYTTSGPIGKRAKLLYDPFPNRGIGQVKIETELKSDFIGGVPIEAFKLSDNYETVPVDGKQTKLRVDRGASRLWFHDLEKPDDFFVGTTFDTSSKTMKMSAYTLGYGGDITKRHPDLFAADILRRSHDLYTQKYGSVDVLEGDWRKNENKPERSVNFTSFNDYVNIELKKIDLNQLEEQTREAKILEIKKQAAKQTWTGKFAASLGYTEVEFYDPGVPTRVSVGFRKPKT